MVNLSDAWNKAIKALKVAEDAGSTAANAASAAENAVSAAENAVSAAENAASAAENAASTATSAASTAANAVSTATSALTSAGSAAADAGQALLQAANAMTAIDKITESLNPLNPSSVVHALNKQIDDIRARVEDAVTERVTGIIRDIEELKDRVFGERDTFEAWCFPAIPDSDPNLADHTFVYCPERNSYFNCWARHGTITGEDTKKVGSGQGRGAFCKAERYRLPFQMPGIPTFPDTAGVGIYGLNGVCHQSANLFLYPVGTILPLTHPSGRPRGVIASYALYGLYGTDPPGAPPQMLPHFARWQAQVYAPAAAACDAAGVLGVDIGNVLTSASAAVSTGKASTAIASATLPASSAADLSLLKASDKATQLLKKPLASMSRTDRDSLMTEIDNTTQETVAAQLADLNRARQHVRDLNSLLAQYIPDLDIGSMQGPHEDILGHKNRILRQRGFTFDSVMKGTYPRLSAPDCDAMVEALNNLALEYQSQLCKTITPAEYIRVNGDRKFYRPIDPSIVRSVLAR